MTKFFDGLWVNGKILYSKPVRNGSAFGCNKCYTVLFEDKTKLVCSNKTTESMFLTYLLRQQELLVEWTQEMQLRAASKCTPPLFLKEGCNSWLRIPKLVRFHHGLHEFGLQFPCGYMWYIKMHAVMSFLERSQAWMESVNLHDRKLVAYAKDEVSTTEKIGGAAAGRKLLDDGNDAMSLSEGSTQSEGIVRVYSLCFN